MTMGAAEDATDPTFNWLKLFPVGRRCLATSVPETKYIGRRDGDSVGAGGLFRKDLHLARCPDPSRTLIAIVVLLYEAFLKNSC
jgi:hypothetical protein